MNYIFLFFLLCPQGHDDVSFHGSPQIPTPNLDAFAADGILLNNYYVQPLCSPSRAALLTGLYPIHTGSLRGLPVQYTHVLGLPQSNLLAYVPATRPSPSKHPVRLWHLGYYKKEFTPPYRGFDSFFGFYNGFGDYYRHLVEFSGHIGLDLWDNDVAVRTECGNYDTDMLTDKAIAIIASHDTTQPLFLYLSHRTAHSAPDNVMLQAPKKNIAKFPYIGERNRTIYAGMVDSMDAAFGRLVEALSDAGILNNTIIVFSSDNGAIPIINFHPNRGFNWPLRGTKYTLWEGAVRVPAFIWSPLLRITGRVSNQMMHIVDWLPTFYSAAGGNSSDLGQQDGFDMWNALSEDAESPRKEMLLNIDLIFNMSSLRSNNHKVVLGTFQNGSLDYRFETTGNRRPVDDLDLLMKRSKAARVLRRLYGTDDLKFPSGWRKMAAVHCGKNNIAKDNIKPASPPYLFDLAADPCELNNIAQDYPEVSIGIEHRILIY
ncbi:unnamed protein product, partial [Ixodes hexagonus]